MLYTIAYMYIQNYPGVSQIQSTKSPTVQYESPNHPDEINTSHVKAHKIHFSNIFWPIFCISGEILDEFLDLIWRSLLWTTFFNLPDFDFFRLASLNLYMHIVQLKARTISRKQLLINLIFVMTLSICIYLWHEQINFFFFTF